jgi:hypothetical protein
MSAGRMVFELNGSHYVYFDEDRQLVCSWKGGKTVNIYDIEGDCVDAFGLDYDKKGVHTVAEVEGKMVEYLEEWM